MGLPKAGFFAKDGKNVGLPIFCILLLVQLCFWQVCCTCCGSQNDCFGIEVKLELLQLFRIRWFDGIDCTIVVDERAPKVGETVTKADLPQSRYLYLFKLTQRMVL